MPDCKNSPLKVLVACESSGCVRDAFNRLGHVATSCDTLESETFGSHYQGDVKDIINDGWDMIIAHPPCTYLNVAAAWAFEDPDYEKYPSVGYHQKVKPGTLVGRSRREAQIEALDFVRLFLDSDVSYVAVENPVGAISSKIRKPDQYIHPYEFGDDASKKTGLWLKGLPTLKPTKYVEPRLVNGKKRWSNQTDSGQNNLGPSENRWRERSRTYQGIANAMALQWGGDTGWRPVSFASDCWCPICEEQGPCGCDSSLCSYCGEDYSECGCIGPTEDDVEYREFHGQLMGRRI